MPTPAAQPPPPRRRPPAKVWDAPAPAAPIEPIVHVLASMPIPECERPCATVVAHARWARQFAIELLAAARVEPEPSRARQLLSVRHQVLHALYRRIERITAAS